MADHPEKVSEGKTSEEKIVQDQMLPPPIPLSGKTKVKDTDVMKKNGISEGNEEDNIKMSKSSSETFSKTEVSDTKGEVEKERTAPQNDEEMDANKMKELTSKEGDTESQMLPPTLPFNKNKTPENTKQIKKQKDKNDFPELAYTEPTWTGVPQEPYSLELLKGGCILSTKHLNSKSCYLFGRLPNCDIVMEHPSISRYHAIIQYKASDSASGKKGFYLYDLGSTHGTKVNKIAVHPKRYYRLQSGYVIKFGGSSRLYILQGPEEMEPDDLPEEMQEQVKSKTEIGKVMTEEELEEWKKEKERKPEETESCSWGFGEDAEEEETANPFASEFEEGIETHVFKDPKKTLRGFFEREGLDLEYQVDETGPGHARVYHCRLKLPVEDANGDPLYAEAAVTGKKRESVLACAAEACRILDMNGLLRQSSHESKKQKLKNWEVNDYYDSDEDTFLDRTGAIEKKRIKRMKMAKKETEEVETFESLCSKLKAVKEEIESLEDKLAKAVKAAKDAEESEDSLDSYMKNIGSSMDKASRMQSRRKIFELKKEKQRLAKLVEISRPAVLPTLVKNQPNTSLSKEIAAKRLEDDNTGQLTSISYSSNTGITLDPVTETRHKKAEDKGEEQPGLESSKLKNTPLDHDEHSGGNIIKDKTETFAKPKIPLVQPKQKPAPSSSSISMVLEGLKSGANQRIDKKTKKEKWPRKHTSDHEETLQEPTQKKKALYPQLQPSSPPSPTQMDVIKYDDDNDDSYSKWVPPSDQTGDGRTKLNEKYGY